MGNSKETIAKNLKNLIKESKKNIPQIAKELKIAHSYLYELTNPNNKKMPTFKMLEKLADYFNVDISKLLENNEKEES